MAKTSRQSFQFMLRLPDELRERLKAAAEETGRSVTAEILERLESSFLEDHLRGGATVEEFEKLKTEVVRQAAINSALNANLSELFTLLAGPKGQARDQAIAVLTALRMHGVKVPE